MAPTQTFSDHIKELRRRILWVVLAIFLSAGVGYVFRDSIIKVLQHPLGAPLFFTSPAGSFNFVLKLSVVAGIFIALPVMIYNLLRFIEPALPVRIKKWLMVKVIASSFLLALAGASFGFFLMIPLSLHFFLGYSSPEVKPLITADAYLSFVMNHMLTFALAFQIPMVFLFINRIKPLKPSSLLKYQRHVIVGAFALAIVLPFTYDPVSQFIVAIPIVFLFYFSVILLWITNRKRRSPPPVVTIQPELPDQPVLTPAPVPAVPAIPALSIPVTSPARRTNAIDGFIKPKDALDLSRPKLVTTYRPLTNAPGSSGPHSPHRGLSIDGIMPNLASSV